jgi:ABC-type dipeptide/oligopeptide/nickel transport system permease component
VPVEPGSLRERMGTYVVRRTLQIVPSLLLITVLVFGLLQVTGGDPIAIMMGPSATSELSHRESSAWP